MAKKTPLSAQEKQALAEKNKTDRQQRAEQKRQAQRLARQKKADEKAKRKAEKAVDKKLTRQEKNEQKRLAQQKRIDEAFAKMSPDEQMEVTLESIAQLQRSNKKWYKLDNAALMYPMISRGESPVVFRLAVQLKEPVNPIVLQYAVNDIFPRFPTICGTVVWGWFWPYIDKPAKPIVVKKQTKLPARPIAVDARHSQIRVNYFGNQIAVEFFHSATDGTGGLIFLNSLLRCYFQRLGIECDRTNCFDHRDIPSLDEVRDNFGKIAVRKNPPPTPPVVKCKVIKGTNLKKGKFVTIRGICSASQLHDVAKQHNASVTEFLGAIQLLALDKLAQATSCTDPKPIRMLVPVNLRKLYDVETIRNFTSYIFYQYNGQKDLDEVIADVQKQTKEQFTDDYFRGMISFNYNSGNNPLLKPVPLALKKLVVSAVVKGRGEGVVNCSQLSNLGVVKAPKEFEDLVMRYEFSVGNPHDNTNYICVSTYNDTCVIAFVSKYAENDCERAFFCKLAELGIDLAVESDIWEDEQ